MMISTRKFFLLLFCIENCFCLYPFESPSRSKTYLNGLWEFKVDFNNQGFKDQWFMKTFEKEFNDSLPISVPSSYNELYTNQAIKVHLGWVWYNRQFYINDAIMNSINRYSISLRFSSCHYYCVVWINGKQLGFHESGHLPFEFDISKLVNAESANNLVVAVNNTLTEHTIPPGKLFYGNNASLYPEDYVEQIYQMDFYNYAGIHRDVIIYIKPVYSIHDIDIKTEYNSITNTGLVNYDISHNCAESSQFTVVIKDQDDNVVGFGMDSIGKIDILKNVKPWWPRFMNGEGEPVGYLYKFEAEMICNSKKYGLTDSYSDKYLFEFGVRSLAWTGNYKPSWLINNKNFYCIGANRHEDSPIIGRGIDLALMLKDVYLLEWLNVNCVRTSHYPYAEEFMQLADRLGIAVIDEVPAVGLIQPENFNPITMNLHKQLLQELYNRDKNHPSVIMWSVANEPASDLKEAFPYFQEIFETINKIDTTRPKTFTCSKSMEKDLCANLTDIIFVNRYYGWYIKTGRLDIIKYQLDVDLNNWFARYGKALVLSEYGADTLAGTHCVRNLILFGKLNFIVKPATVIYLPFKYPELMFCEEFQSSLLIEHHKVFDNLKGKSILYGELIWNFIDFMTTQDLKRPYGNHKGMFTADRQPKQASFILKKRYESLGKDLNHDKNSEIKKKHF